jgi:hypothetical protein
VPPLILAEYKSDLPELQTIFYQDRKKLTWWLAALPAAQFEAAPRPSYIGKLGWSFGTALFPTPDSDNVQEELPATRQENLIGG